MDNLCFFNNVIRAKIIQYLSRDDVEKLSMISKLFFAKIANNKSLWQGLIRQKYNTEGTNSLNYYYGLGVNCYGMGENNYNILKLGKIAKSVKSVSNYGTNIAIVDINGNLKIWGKSTNEMVVDMDTNVLNVWCLAETIYYMKTDGTVYECYKEYFAWGGIKSDPVNYLSPKVYSMIINSLCCQNMTNYIEKLRSVYKNIDIYINNYDYRIKYCGTENRYLLLDKQNNLVYHAESGYKIIDQNVNHAFIMDIKQSSAIIWSKGCTLYSLPIYYIFKDVRENLITTETFNSKIIKVVSPLKTRTLVILTADHNLYIWGDTFGFKLNENISSVFFHDNTRVLKRPILYCENVLDFSVSAESILVLKNPQR